MTKTYFLTHNLDYSPSVGIRLGSIWTNPADPGSCVNRDGPLPFPSNMPIDSSWKTDWQYEKDRQREGIIGIWARFLQVVGIDIEASVNWDNIDGSAYKFDKLETEFVDPTLEYIRESVLSTPVTEFIRSNDFKKPVYMITGVKIARGADVALADSKGAGTHLRAGVDGTAAGAPAGAGPKVTISSKDSESMSFGGSSDFVFAYRLRKIFYEKGQAMHAEYNKGATMGVDGGSVEGLEADSPPVPTLKILRLGKEDVSAKGSQFTEQSVADEDGEERCHIIYR